MSNGRTCQLEELARIAGVSVRALQRVGWASNHMQAQAPDPTSAVLRTERDFAS